jgi:hypothetical protein
MARDRSTESYAEAGRARWAGTTPEQRREDTLPARSGRGRVKDVEQKVDLLGAVLLDRLDALQAEVAALRSERVAA